MPRLSLSLCCLAALLACALPAPAPAQEPAPAPYGEIDPLAVTSGNFLDIDLAEVAAQAAQAYQAKDYKLAAQAYLYALRFNVDDSATLYRLACCYGQLGEPVLTALTIERAARAGFENLGELLTSPAFEQVRETEQFYFAVQSVAGYIQARHQSVGELKLFKAEALLPCRVQTPSGYDPSRAYPLVIALHGHGSNANYFARMWLAFDKPQFIYATPQAPYGFLSGKDVGYSWFDIPDARAPENGSIELAEQSVLDLLGQLRAQYKISDVYILGFSQGGIMAYDIGITHPDLVKGIAVFGAWLDSERLGADVIAQGKGLRVFIGHGVGDETVKVERAREARRILEEAGYNVQYTEYPGAHGLGLDAMQAAGKWIEAP